MGYWSQKKIWLISKNFKNHLRAKFISSYVDPRRPPKSCLKITEKWVPQQKWCLSKFYLALCYEKNMNAVASNSIGLTCYILKCAAVFKVVLKNKNLWTLSYFWELFLRIISSFFGFPGEKFNKELYYLFTFSNFYREMYFVFLFYLSFFQTVFQSLTKIIMKNIPLGLLNIFWRAMQCNVN